MTTTTVFSLLFILSLCTFSYASSGTTSNSNSNTAKNCTNEQCRALYGAPTVAGAVCQTVSATLLGVTVTTCAWNYPPTTDPCNPSNLPICAINSPPPCQNSKCTNTGGTISSVAQALQNCKWTSNGTCTLSNPCAGKCSLSTCPCDLARCLPSGSDSCAWNSSNCNIDCATMNIGCPGFSNCPFNGSCQSTSTGCSWTCPIDGCQDSNGNPTCQGNAPTPPSSDLLCPNWQSKCMNNVLGKCEWSWYCVYPQSTGTPGIYSSSMCVNATKIPNGDCPNKSNYTCVRTPLPTGGVTPYYWYAYCPQKISFDIDTNVQISTNCSSGNCGLSQYSLSSLQCGSNSASVSACIRAGSICVSASACVNTVPVTSCISTCNGVCYDPAWLENPSAAPESFNASSINAPCPSFDCNNFCQSSNYVCGRKSGNTVCQNYNPNGDSDATIDSNCASICNGKPVAPVVDCQGSDPCNCNYTACKFVSYSLFGADIGMCVPQSRDTDSIRGYCNVTVYVSTTLPAVCLVSSVTTSYTSLGLLVARISVLSSDTLQAILSSVASNGNKTIANFIAKYYPKVNSIAFPNVYGGVAKIGVVLSLSSNPSGSDSVTLCELIELILKDPSVVGEFQLSGCVSATVGTSSVSSSSKRDILQSGGSVSVLVQTSANTNVTVPMPAPTTGPTAGPTTGPTASPAPGPTAGPTAPPTTGPSSTTPTPTPTPTPVSPPNTAVRATSTSAVIVGIIGLVVMSLMF